MNKLQKIAENNSHNKVKLPVLKHFLNTYFPAYKNSELEIKNQDGNNLLLMYANSTITISTSQITLLNTIRYIGALKHENHAEKYYALFAYENKPENPEENPRMNHYYQLQNPPKKHIQNIPLKNHFQKRPYYKAIKHAHELLRS